MLPVIGQLHPAVLSYHASLSGSDAYDTLRLNQEPGERMHTAHFVPSDEHVPRDACWIQVHSSRQATMPLIHLQAHALCRQADSAACFSST